MHRFFRSDEFQFAFLFTLSGAYHRCADAGEVLATAERIKDSNQESWFTEWGHTADAALEAAEGAGQGGHLVSARDAYLRASAYLATALYAVAGSKDPSRERPAWDRHRDAFDRAMALSDPPAEHLEIPYEDTTLPGYLLRADGSGERRPLLIMNNGSDGAMTAMIAQGGGGGLRRGYNVLLFDGPGQQAALMRQGLFFRPDWEAVLTPVVDHAVGRPDVDPDRIGVIGVSQAGYWVPRAIAFEKRIRAAVADPGVTDVGATWTSKIGHSMTKLLERGDKEKFDRDMRMAERFVPGLRASLEFRMKPYGLESVFDVYRALEEYRLTPDVLARIDTPLLITDPDHEQFWPGQSRQLHQALTGPKELVRFTAAEGADSHCEPAAPGVREQRIFDWLDTALGV